ncbi:MAG: SCO family protein [Acidimicrobiaceae bacterium]|nr:SCO family protein [Acidimicrobiaceae bacterium]
MTDQIPGDKLSEEARREAFRDELRLTTENGAGRIVGRISKKVLWGGVGVLAVLGLGGQAVEHYFGNLGLPTSTGPTTTFTAPTTTPSQVSTTTTVSAASADAAFIGLKLIGTAQAPAFTLTDQHGHPYGTHQASGRVTLITFFNKNCNDICPVLGAELKLLLSDLANNASRINIIIVNTDPFSYGASANPLALTQTGLSAYSNVHFLTGPLASLNSIWKSYGIEVKVGVNANQVAHNSVIYFANSTSGLVGFAKPFAAQNANGSFSLSNANIARFAEGLHYETVSLNQ